jgi:hypothetical protein
VLISPSELVGLKEMGIVGEFMKVFGKNLPT